MKYQQFNILWEDAVKSQNRDTYVYDWALSSMWGDDTDIDALIPQLQNIWDVAHMTFGQLRAVTGLTQIKFSERFRIPRRTLEGWEAKGNYADYTKIMISNLIGLISVDRT